jgi:hypothetical protein
MISSLFTYQIVQIMNTHVLNRHAVSLNDWIQKRATHFMSNYIKPMFTIRAYSILFLAPYLQKARLFLSGD